MSYSQEAGYTPRSFETIMGEIRVGINQQFGTTYTTETFEGTGWYKYAYSLVQKIQENEIKTSEIFQKLQEYISITNEAVQRPSVSAPGMIQAFEAEGFTASVKPPLETNAGKIYVCVDLDESADDFADKKLEVCNLIKDYVAAGIVSQGTQSESIVLSNGQSFDFKFELPTRIPVLLRLTVVESENNLLIVPDDETLREVVFDNVNARYKLGFNFEPQRYFSLSDALWAGSVVLEWSNDDGENWYDTVYDAEYTDLFEFEIDDISVVIS